MQYIQPLLRIIEAPQPTTQQISWGLLAVRVATAVFFITHGYGKLFAAPGIDGFTEMLVGLGVPLAALFAWLVAIAEFFGGIAILLGVATRFSAFWLAVISFVAFALVKGFALGLDEGDLDVLALGLTLALVAMGPGAFSVSAYLTKPVADEMPHT